MKKTLLAGLMIAGMSVVAQTPRLSLYEEFTGENCGPCASTNPGLNALLASPTNSTKIIAIKWEVPIPSAPTPTWSLYKTNQAEIDWRYKSLAAGGYGYIPAVTYAPFGKIDGQSQAVFGASGANVDHPANLTSGIISTAQALMSAFSITMTRAWDPTFSAVDLTVTIQATAPFSPVGNLVFRTVMVEREVHFPSAPGTNGEKDFKDVGVKSFPTLQNGIAMTPGSWIIGQTQTFVLNCPLPSYIRDKAEVAFVGFIQDEGSQKVAQAVRAEKTAFTNDAKAESIAAFPVITCAANVTPTITVKNNGANTITGFDVTPYVNGVAGTLFNWTGSLAVGATTTFPISSVNITSGTNTFSYTISSVVGTDNNMLNNGISRNFIGVSGYQGTAVAEGFVSSFPPAGWATYNNNGANTWIKVAAPLIGGFAASGECTKLDFFNGVANGSVNELFLPAMSFTGAAVPTMSFDVAYAQYTAADNDMLEVKVSSDCGNNWTTVFTKSGTTLATTGIVNPLPFTPSLAAQWRKEVVTFPASFMNTNLIVKFVGTSGFGNNLYLDNINLASCNNQTVTAGSGKTKICKGESVSVFGGGATTYSWSTGQSTGSFVTSPTVTTTYIANSSDAGSCKNSAAVTVTVDACAGIAAADLNIGAVNLFPNPAAGSTNLSIELTQNENLTVSVINSVGQVMHTSSHNMNAGANNVNLNTENWANGVYFVTVSSTKGSVNQKLTVTK